MLFIAGSLMSLLRERQAHRAALRDATFLIGQLVVFGLQIRYALRLIANGHDTDAAQAIAILVVVCFLLGISRSWELVGGPSFSFFGQSFAFVRDRRDRSDGDDEGTSVASRKFGGTRAAPGGRGARSAGPHA